MNIQPITSLSDPRLDPYRDVRDKDLRGRDRLFMAESDLVIRRLLRQPDRLHSLFLSPTRLEALGTALHTVPDEIPIFVAPVDLMTQVAGFHIHRGVLAAGRRPTRAELRPEVALADLRGRDELCLLVAEGLTNVDNIGALFRNGAAFGVDGILLDPACCDPLYRKAIRVSMGHVFSIPWAVSTAWPDDLAWLQRELGVTVIAAELDDRSVPLWEIPRGPKRAFLFGAEATGVSAEVRESCDALVEIPMAPGVASLNVSVTSAIVLYAARFGHR